MDIARPDRRQQRQRRRAFLAAGGALALVLASLGLIRLKPGAPSVERSTLSIDTVKRGEMLRQVHGSGTLVPEQIRWVPAATEGRVERILLQPGTPVRADSLILELSNPELELQAAEADSRRRASAAQLAEVKVRLEVQRIDQKAATARVLSEYQQARLRAEADAALGREGLVPDLTVKLSQSAAAELQGRYAIEQERLAMFGAAAAAQLAVSATHLDQARGLANLRRRQVAALHVQAGLDGVLQNVLVEVGQRVAPGTNLARVAQPERLKAVVRVAETQAQELRVGQKASVDTRVAVLPARVARVDPAVQNGTVTVDLAIEGDLRSSVRPDLSVDGTIELERLSDVLYVGRPTLSQTNGRVGLFRLSPDGREATRVQVQLGRRSVGTIEVIDGLREGDRVILSDTATWDAFERLRLY